jgi:predicted membrane metal-binding protein
MTHYEPDAQPVDKRADRGSSWATGGVIFAATLMIMIGLFQAFQGLAGIIEDEFYVTVDNYVINLDTTTWGWVHLIIGALVAVAGFFLISGSTVAALTAVVLAGLSAVSNFLFIPYYPFWSLLIIALAVYVIWSIYRSGLLGRR